MSLVVVQNDAEYQLVKVQGRFSVPAECSATTTEIAEHGLEAFPHLQWYVEHEQEKMIDGLRRQGSEYQKEHGFNLEGPMPHLVFSTDTAPDPGPLPPPHPKYAGYELTDRYRTELARWEAAEKARAARRMGDTPELVDYCLIGIFRQKLPRSFRSSNFPLGKAVLDPQQPPSPARLKALRQQFPALFGAG